MRRTSNDEEQNNRRKRQRVEDGVASGSSSSPSSDNEAENNDSKISSEQKTQAVIAAADATAQPLTSTAIVSAPQVTAPPATPLASLSLPAMLQTNVPPFGVPNILFQQNCINNLACSLVLVTSALKANKADTSQAFIIAGNEIASLKREMNEMRTQMQRLRDENAEQKQQIENLTNENRLQAQKWLQLKNQYDELAQYRAHSKVTDAYLCARHERLEADFFEYATSWNEHWQTYQTTGMGADEFAKSSVPISNRPTVFHPELFYQDIQRNFINNLNPNLVVPRPSAYSTALPAATAAPSRQPPMPSVSLAAKARFLPPSAPSGAASVARAPVPPPAPAAFASATTSVSPP